MARYRVDALIFAPEQRPSHPYIVVDTHGTVPYYTVAYHKSREDADKACALLNAYAKCEEALRSGVTNAAYVASRHVAHQPQLRCQALYPRGLAKVRCQWEEGHLGPHNSDPQRADLVWGGEPTRIIPDWLLPALQALDNVKGD